MIWNFKKSILILSLISIILYSSRSIIVLLIDDSDDGYDDFPYDTIDDDGGCM